ncbi:hypothetical protein BV25DRAFT_1821220 [Artomyces pyxidatus]|uniref:Uncharacterized protein n=1 Tax=Artomyces pyxidatus TaxID=48021 RepID=A0ACB8TCH1_9AGAM|nr:hypothetical protein BV25DRAFT_1821220 [Artomyces pyxidatus]
MTATPAPGLSRMLSVMLPFLLGGLVSFAIKFRRQSKVGSIRRSDRSGLKSEDQHSERKQYICVAFVRRIVRTSHWKGRKWKPVSPWALSPPHSSWRLDVSAVLLTHLVS